MKKRKWPIPGQMKRRQGSLKNKVQNQKSNINKSSRYTTNASVNVNNAKIIYDDFGATNSKNDYGNRSNCFEGRKKRQKYVSHNHQTQNSVLKLQFVHFFSKPGFLIWYLVC